MVNALDPCSTVPLSLTKYQAPIFQSTNHVASTLALAQFFSGGKTLFTGALDSYHNIENKIKARTCIK